VIAWAFVYKGRIDDQSFRMALSEVLCDFPLLAGRFSSTSAPAPGGAKILHNNAGVPVIVGKDSKSSSDLSVTPILEDRVSSISAQNLPSYLNSMNLQRVYQGKEAILTFRLTHLLDGGTMLGVTVPHAVVDGRSLAAFLSAVSQRYQGQDYPKPVIDREILTYQPLASLCTEKEVETFHLQKSGRKEKLSMAARLASHLSNKYFDKGAAASKSKRVHPTDQEEGRNTPLETQQDDRDVGDLEEEEEEEDLASKLSVWGSVGYLLKIFWEFVRGAELHTVLVRICPDEIGKIKEESQVLISKNDIAVAYSWILMKKLQERLGYVERSDRCDKSRMLLAADLRVKNRLQRLSDNYFGNAVLAVDVTGPAHMSLLECATAVRKVVSDLKQTKTKSIMRSVWKLGQESFLRTLPALVTSLPCYHDCFITSWQFPFNAFTFGLSPPTSLFPGMFPRCPWTAIIVNDLTAAAAEAKDNFPTSSGSDQTKRGAGIYVHMTLPSAAYELLQCDPSVHSHMNRVSILNL
jgi:hypothetical protein